MPYKIALIQQRINPVREENLTHTAELIELAALKGANVVCLPELFADPYFCQTENSKNFDLAEEIPGKTLKQFSEIAWRLGIVLILPIFEKAAPGVYYNTCCVIDHEGKLLGYYRKMHIPDDPSYYEKYYFTPGDKGFMAFDTKFGKIGVLICWDQWFPEAARLTALHGAEVIFYPTAIGWHPAEKERYGKAQIESWKAVQRGHSIANGVYIAAANRTGLEMPDENSDGIEFWGNSFVYDPQGVELCSATEAEEILIADINPKHLEIIRRNWPFLRDRRIDAYSDINKRLII